jgi:hypothetical protein
LGEEDVVNNLRSDKVANLDFLKKDHGVCHFTTCPFTAPHMLTHASQ